MPEPLQVGRCFLCNTS